MKSGSSRTVSLRFCAIRSMKSSAVLAVDELALESLQAQLAVAAHRLREQLLLGAEVVVQQAARDAASRETWSKVEPAVPRRATLRRIASMIRWAFSPESERARRVRGRAPDLGVAPAASCAATAARPWRSLAAPLGSAAGELAGAGAGVAGAVVEL